MSSLRMIAEYVKYDHRTICSERVRIKKIIWSSYRWTWFKPIKSSNWILNWILFDLLVKMSFLCDFLIKNFTQVRTLLESIDSILSSNVSRIFFLFFYQDFWSKSNHKIPNDIIPVFIYDIIWTRSYRSESEVQIHWTSFMPLFLVVNSFIRWY